MNTQIPMQIRTRRMGSSRKMVLLGGFVLAAALPLSSYAFQVTVPASKDAQLRQNEAASNFGSDLENDVRVQRSPSTLMNRRTIVGFDFSDGEFLGCTIDAASFEMFLESAYIDRTLDVHPLTGTWTEAGVTWTSAGLMTSGALASSSSFVDGAYNQTVTWTGFATLVQAAVDDQSELTLRIKDPIELTAIGGPAINVNSQYTSKEGAADPGAPLGSYVPRMVLEVTCDDCESWAEEAAWADGERYRNPGNWATYASYAAENTVGLFADQTDAAGTVSFSSPVAGEVTITITLNAYFRFADVVENVKVENYARVPSSNPAPGRFSDKDYADPGSQTFEIVVPLGNYYGVQVDVERCVDEDIQGA